MISSSPPAESPNILVLDPARVHTPSDNRQITLEDVGDLLGSIRADSQHVPGIVFPHSDLPEEWMCADGNRRLFVCRLLGLPFKAVAAPRGLTRAGLIRIRTATNCIRRAMTPWQIAADVLEFQRLEGCTQEEAAGQLNLAPATVSRSLKVFDRLAPDLKPWFADGRLASSVAYILTELPHERQREVAERAIKERMTRDTVTQVVAGFRGKGSQKPKSRLLRGKLDGREVSLAILPADTADTLIEWFKGVAAKLGRHRDIPPESLGFLFGK